MLSTFTNIDGPDVSPNLSTRDGSRVTVLYRVGVQTEVDTGPLYRVRFPDGYQTDAWAVELEPRPDESLPAHGNLIPEA